MKKGCLLSIGILLFTIISFVCYGAYSIYRFSNDEMPKINILTNKFIEYYNAGKYSDIYKMYSKRTQLSIPEEKNVEQIKRIIQFTGYILSFDQKSFNTTTLNSEESVIVVYDGKADKGNCVISIKYIREGTWVIDGFNINSKL